VFKELDRSPAIHKEIRIDPMQSKMTIAEAFQTANRYLQIGQLEPAENLLRYVLELDPGHAGAQSALGQVRAQKARHQIHTAKALASQGRLDEAIVALRHTVELAPADPAVHANLGVALGMQGRHEEAIASLRRAVDLNPGHGVAHSNLGEALRRAGRLDEAIQSLRQAIRLRPQLAPAHNNLGIALFEQGHLREALACYQAALAIDPNYADALNNRGNALRQQGDLKTAEASLLRALELQPDFPVACNNLGLVLRDQNRLDEARVRFEQALDMVPTLADAHANLGELQQELGDLEQAALCFREAQRHEPGHGAALAALATMLRAKLPDEELARVQDRLADPFLGENARIALLFGLAQALDGRGQYDRAAIHLETANALEGARWRKRGRAYDPAEHTRFVDSLRKTFTPEFFHKMRNWGADSPRPVFIFGLPRSGTSLIEHIVASHSQVYGGGELPFAGQDFQALVDQDQAAAQPALQHEAAIAALQRLDQETVQRVAQQHLRRLRDLHPTAARVTSKMPCNWRYLGLLAVLFPQARFIHCRRDLRDVAVSCWATRFQHLNWTCDLDHLASRFHDYRRLMEHWRGCLPVPMLEIDYEETVADLEGTARRLLNWMGLECEPACLNFHETRRPVRTASAAQVRQPLYRSSVGRWRNYATALEPLFQRLPEGP
jgi:tetratricopeptide (TPR) repeat protein